MKALIFLGDEAHAAGFRLAGLEVRIAPPGREQEALACALAEAEVLIVGTACAAALPAAALATAQAAGRPPLLVLPAEPGAEPLGDPAATVRRLLGLV